MTASSPSPINWPGTSGLDRLLEHRMRLGIAVLLSQGRKMTFRHLKDRLHTSDGNLGAHLGKLEAASYLAVNKIFEDKKPVSWYSLTPSGSKALREHLANLERIIQTQSTPRKP